MSNYRTFYDRPSWSKQSRRGARKVLRDRLAGGPPPAHPNRGKGLSGHPGRRRQQLAERAR